ncbi:MAG: pyrroline-5-carboxylate reductase [Bacteroidales bacterium 45-6]|nr:MAG: pyrroline-5-carboxylate reductase [Bacteroidales bacterium 45-6]
MKISIIGGGNMGGAIAYGLSSGKKVKGEDITVIDLNPQNVEAVKAYGTGVQATTNDYSSVCVADVVILAVKPWLIKPVLEEHRGKFDFSKQVIISIAAGITLAQLQEYTSDKATVFRLIPNTAIAIKQSMTFVASANASKEQEELVLSIFAELGKAILINESQFGAVTSLSSCGIAYAFRYIRAAMEGGVEMGIPSGQAKEIVIQTLRGAIELLEANGSHPEVEIDKVTTPGGITIKGLNEMEHAGFTSAVIRGLKASNPK